MKKISTCKRLCQDIQHKSTTLTPDDAAFSAHCGEGCSVFAFPSIRCGNVENDGYGFLGEDEFASDNWQHIYIAFDGCSQFAVWHQVTAFYHKILEYDLSPRQAIRIAYAKQRKLRKFIAPDLRAC